MNIDPRITDPTKRYDFLILFDVTDGNPNGDPDAGNLPRIDPETMQGIVTDVCLKRKIRNYVDMVYRADYDELDRKDRFGIFVRDSGVALNTKVDSAKKDADPTNNQKKIASEKGRKEMCRRYFDVRTFGAVMTTGENCGQVRGPMQLTFARSVDPVIPSDISITRVAITKEGQDKESEMGRKSQVPYGLYVGKGYFSPMLAKDTGLDAADLELFWKAVADMFENDRSAARGDMRLRQVYIFRHDDPLGNDHAGRLFDRIAVNRKPEVDAARQFGDYVVAVDEASLPQGITLIKLMG